MQKIIQFINRKNLISNTLVMLFTSFLIKMLGLLYKIIITRLLGSKGMELYVLIFPTLLLFTAISGFSLNVTTTKLISDSYETRKYSPRMIIKKSIKLSVIVSTMVLIIFLLIHKILINNLLRNPNLFFPSLAIIPLLYLVGISDTLRGYFNGIKEVSTSSLSILIEQISRIIGSLSLIFLFRNLNIQLLVLFCLLGQSIGEIGSIIYTLLKMRKMIDFKGSINEEKAIIQMALPLTCSKIIGNFTYFLEPIIYTSFFLAIGYSKDNISSHYTIINAYTMPLLTISSFFSMALASSIIPYVSQAYAKKDMQKLNFYFQKSIIYALIPGLFMTIILFFFSKDLMNLLYGTTLGSEKIKPIVFLFLFYYVHLPIYGFLQAIGQNKFLLTNSIIFNIARLLLICLFGLFSLFGLDSLLYAIIISMILSTIVQLIRLCKIIKISFDYSKLGWLFLLTLFISLVIIILQIINLKFYLIIMICLLIYLLFLVKLDFIKINRINDY